MSNIWPTTTIGELFEIGAGKSVTPAARHGERRHPFLRTANVFWGRVDLNEVDSMHFSDNEIAAKSLRKGDLLVCEGGDIGRSAIWNGEIKECSFQNHIHRLRPRTKDVVPHFYMYFLQAGFTQLGIYEGAGNKTTIPNLSQSRLSALQVPSLKKPEQEKIAAGLWKIQHGIETEEKLIATSRELKQSALSQLFTHGLRPEPQKQTELGPTPHSWKEAKLYEVADLKNGYAFSSKDYVASSNTLNVRMSNIRPGGEFNLDYSLKYLPDDYVKSHSNFLLAEGDLIIAMTDMAGNPKILGVPTIVRHAFGRNLLLNQRVGRLVPTRNEEVDFEFLKCLLSRKEAQNFLISRAKKGVQVNVGKHDILSIPISYPPTDEQREITTILQTIDRKIFVHVRKRALLQELFNTALHQLMTCKIRVAELDIDVSEIKS